MSVMPRVAVAHVSMGRGGSEARVMWGIEALRHDFDVTLVTAGRVRADDLQELNQFYGTRLAPGHFRVLEAPVLPGMRGNRRADALRGSLFQRFCRKVAPRFDVLVSAYNPCDFGRSAIHFIADFCWHQKLQKQFDPMPREAQRLIHRQGPLRWTYLALAGALSQPSGRNLFAGDDLLVMNSAWTAGVMHECCGVADAPVIYPPVLADFPPVLWDKKESGFVCIGRISYEKRVEAMIEIVRRVRELGHDVHLHVIGPISDTPYGHMIRRLCKEHASWILTEGQLTGDAKARLLTGHRFGIHARDCEAFGISVAEMVKAGCIPFVPARGGPAEIVGEPSLCYRSVDEAVAKIDAVLRDDARQRRLAAELAERAAQFSPQRFMREFRQVTARFLKRAYSNRAHRAPLL